MMEGFRERLLQRARTPGCLRCAFLWLICFSGSLTLAQENPGGSLQQASGSLWRAGIGEGFTRGAHELTLSGGGGWGMAVLGSTQPHDWAIGALDLGWFFSDVVGRDHWYRGNWELVVDIFGGLQYRPTSDYLVGVAPLMRYNFATGSRFVPFLELGGGVTATSIRNGDLSTTFEFNLQGGGGVRYFIRRDLALAVEYRFIHLSNANTKLPNQGVNSSTVLLGVSWFF